MPFGRHLASFRKQLEDPEFVKQQAQQAQTVPPPPAPPPQSPPETKQDGK